MARLIRGGWPYRHFPNASFKLNRWSPQSKGLVAWWPTLGSAGAASLREWVGGLAPGVFNGSPVWAIDPVLGSTLAMVRADNDYIDLNTTIQALAPGDGSVVWWINHAIAWNDNAARVAMWGADDPFVPEFSAQKFIDGNLYIGFNEAADDDRVVVAASATNWLQNAVNCYVLTWVSGGFTRLYHQGIEIGNNGGGTTVRAPSGNLLLGRLGSEAFFYEGLFGEMRLYNIAKSSTEVYQLYAKPWELYRPEIGRFTGWRAPVVAAAIMNQIQFANLGADLFDGALI